MKSRITIEMDFSNASPYFRVLHDRKSDDVRDKLITQFTHLFEHTSSWCRVKFDGTGLNGTPLFEIHPITPSQLKQELQIILEQVALLDKLPEHLALTH